MRKIGVKTHTSITSVHLLLW